MAKKINMGKITESRVEEGLAIRDRLVIELLVHVLDEQLVVERHILQERLNNLVDLSSYDEELKDTVRALIMKL
ncbi:phosphate-starvation-inducible protein PsiE [Caryophanon tenue]|uniref:Phosphate-starvation-inducible protein PsiE n=1 Tax=Caryophanon tenue TaxID=33978 RepID=A0A1C0YNC4_9BACL|nr:phosphate-starvation-inducible protein PsiE [Caryophanon tenue]OCS88569.1 phosphate-starvation-inducible protein PsiE [Caryophanon tenue]